MTDTTDSTTQQPPAAPVPPPPQIGELGSAPLGIVPLGMLVPMPTRERSE